MFKKARKRYTAITTPPCDCDYCQDTTDFTPEHADRFINPLNQTDLMIDSTVPHHAKEQPRRKSINTTMECLHSAAETRNGTVEQIW